MSVKKRSLISNVLTAAFMICFFTMNAFAYILQNGSGTGYSGGNGDSTSEGSNTIESLIIHGSGYVLQGNSHIREFLNRVELQDFDGIDFNELAPLVNRAFENITQAVETYDRLIRMAEVTPYNPGVIQQLKDFDYDSFRDGQLLNGTVFGKVREYLSRGDITGSLKHMRSYIAFMESLLASMKDDLYFKRLPQLPVLWKLNETCAEACLFGSYTARLFYKMH